MRETRKKVQHAKHLTNHYGLSFTSNVLFSVSKDDGIRKYMEAAIKAIKRPLFNEQFESKKLIFSKIVSLDNSCLFI